MASKRIAFCGMEGEGRTKSEATKDAQDRIEFTLSGNWTPFMLIHHGCHALVFRQPLYSKRQWGYTVFQPDDGNQELAAGTCFVSETREPAISAAAYHLAQMAGTYIGLEHRLSPQEIADLDAYFIWQADYAEAKASGMNDAEAHAHACNQRSLA